MQYKGTVKWFDPNKMFGFLDGGPDGDVFVHSRNLDGRDELIEGQEVTFQVRPTEKGTEAIAVEVTRESSLPPRRRLEQGSFGSRPSFGSGGGGGRSSYRGDEGGSRPAYGGGAGRPPRSNGRERSAPVRPGQVPTGPVEATVVTRDQDDRFLFVQSEGEQFDVFVHGSLFRHSLPDLRRGDRVRVSVEQSDRGLRATTIERA